MEQDAPRQVPYDVDIEQALLGAILVDNYSLERVSNSLKAEHFYDPLHQRLYDAIERMWAKGHVVTPLTLKSLMEQDAGLAEVGGQAYLISLARAAPALPNVKDYARILVDLAMRRELIRIGYEEVAAGSGTQVALVRVGRTAFQPEREGGPVSVGVGGATGGHGSGIGLGIGINLSGPPPEQVTTELGVMIRDRASGETLWEGRANFSVRAGSPLAQTQLGSAKMAEALFLTFPGNDGETVEIR